MEIPVIYVFTDELKELQKKFGFTVENVVAAARQQRNRRGV
jgi:hypothetical protein